MPITFEQPGAYDRGISTAYGAAQALKDFLPYLQRSYGQGGGGGGSGGGGRGGGIGGLSGDPNAQGGGGGRGGGETDPLALYQGKQEIDRYFQELDQQKAVDAIRGNTAEAAPDEGEITSLKGRQERQWQRDVENEDQPYGQPPAAQEEFPTYDEAGTGVVQGVGEGGAQGPVEGNSGNWRGLEPGTVAPGQPGQNIPAAQRPAPPAPPTTPPEFTQSDGLQLQRLQAARSRVQSQLQSGMVDPGTARRMIRQMQIPISVLRQQQQAAQTQAAQMQLQQAQEAHAHQTAMELTSTRMRASAGADGIRRDLPDGRGGTLPPSQWNDRAQRWEAMPHVQESADRAATREAAERNRRLAISNHVSTEMSRERQGVPRPSWIDDPRAEAAERQRRIERAVREASGRPGTEPGQAQPSPPSQEDRDALERMLQGISMPTLAAQPSPQPRPAQRSGMMLPGFGGGANFE